MKIQYLIFFSAILLSCNKTDKIPAELYSLEQMAVILKDVYILEFKTTELKVRADSAVVVFKKYQDDYFDRNNLDTAKYTASYDFYFSRPELMERIYEIIADSLSLKNRIIEEKTKSEEEKKVLKADSNTVEPLEIKKPDSIKIIN